jgi:S1-C subfamily serine protease
MINALEPGGPAALAGLMSLDTVVRADGAPVTGVDDLIRLLNGERIGRRIAIDVLRRGALRTFEVTPLERPAARAAGSRAWLRYCGLGAVCFAAFLRAAGS